MTPIKYKGDLKNLMKVLTLVLGGGCLSMLMLLVSMMSYGDTTASLRVIGGTAAYCGIPAIFTAICYYATPQQQEPRP
jgi:hypothetical protein